MDSTTTLIVVAAVIAAALLAVAVGLLVRLVRARRGLRRAGLPTGPRWVFWGAVAYLILPTDLLPDPVYIDDIGVLLLALRSMRRPAVAMMEQTVTKHGGRRARKSASSGT